MAIESSFIWPARINITMEKTIGKHEESYRNMEKTQENGGVMVVSWDFIGLTF